MITKRQFSILAAATVALGAASVQADEYQDTINIFRKAEESGKFFGKAHGYAVSPTIGKGGLMYEAAIAGQKFNYKPK